MESVITLDPSNRIVLTKDLRKASGIGPAEALKVVATPGRIVIERDSAVEGKVIRRGKWKVWTGDTPVTPIEEAVKDARHYTR